MKLKAKQKTNKKNMFYYPATDLVTLGEVLQHGVNHFLLVVEHSMVQR